MKIYNIVKLTPFLLISLLIISLTYSNQKVNTKLRILIWNTPSLSLGKYIAISTGAGFIFSYIATNSIANQARLKDKKSINYKNEDINELNNEYISSNLRKSIDKTLIERDINDPSPTMNAKFRVIGKTDGYNSDYLNNNSIQDDSSNEIEEPYLEYRVKNDNINQSNEISNDWNDDSYTSW
tara:strand:+ start:1213 stop:1758 length:546 start_codon:yes stop_codon:yes gene_type:complete